MLSQLVSKLLRISKASRRGKWPTADPSKLGDPLWHCRVCGLLWPAPPWGEDGKSPMWDFCPCCGVETGYGDSSLTGARRWREKWLAAGAEWEFPKEKPPDWDLEEQLQYVPEQFR
jgi:hypothetical protein